jgi:hypothetical protein
MPNDAQNVYEIAAALIDHYGIRATSVANFQALWARHNADRETMQVWHWIAGATEEILRSDP